jgi:hypothetical protein
MNIKELLRQFVNKLFKVNYMVKKPTEVVPGLYDEKDDRNFGSDAIFKPTKTDLPTESFMVYDPILKDQFDTDMCVGFGGSYIREATENVQTAGEFLFALCKKAAGTIAGFGTSILQMCKVAVNSGVPEWKFYKLTGNGQRNKFANWNNISQDAYADAKNHLASSYFEVVKGQNLDFHDTFKAYLWHFRDKKLLIASGVDAHFTTLIGWKAETDEIISKDSYNQPAMNYRIGRYEAGTGYRYWKRNESNQLFTSYMITDLPRDVAELLNTYKDKAVIGTDRKVYLISDGKKRWIPDEETAWAYNIYLWYDLNILTDDELDLIPDGEPIKFEDAPPENIKKLTEILNSPNILERVKGRLNK